MTLKRILFFWFAVCLLSVASAQTTSAKSLNHYVSQRSNVLAVKKVISVNRAPSFSVASKISAKRLGYTRRLIAPRTATRRA